MPIFDSNSLEVTPEQAQAAIAEDQAQIIDVREPYEWEAGRIEGAEHIALDQLQFNLTKIDSDRPVIFQCRVGGRSMMAAQALRGVGIDAYSMAGGLLRWANEDRPLMPEGGHVANH
ncbi:MAG TPA: rhodanese-like domain-containing protein [Solirubrobacteraceae bacterium]|nr:rhodanese-like domain-containing protein [Solirubrobacteraceae bacterium]